MYHELTKCFWENMFFRAKHLLCYFVDIAAHLEMVSYKRNQHKNLKAV